MSYKREDRIRYGTLKNTRLSVYGEINLCDEIGGPVNEIFQTQEQQAN